jgi:hypothetical protein
MSARYHVITPLMRHELVPGLIKNLEPLGVIWHPIPDKQTEFPTLDWIQPVTIIPTDPRKVATYVKFNEFGRIAGWVDDDYYVYQGDDNLYAPDCFDELRKIKSSPDLIMITMRRGDRRPNKKSHYCDTLVACPENRRVGRIGFEQLVMTGRLRKKWPYEPEEDACADGILAEKLAKSDIEWHYAPRAECWFNVFEPGRWNSKPL